MNIENVGNLQSRVS